MSGTAARVPRDRSTIFPPWVGVSMAVVLACLFISPFWRPGATWAAVALAALSVLSAALSTTRTRLACAVFLTCYLVQFLVPESTSGVGSLLVFWLPLVLAARFGPFPALAFSAVLLGAEYALEGTRGLFTRTEINQITSVNAILLGTSVTVGGLIGRHRVRTHTLETTLREDANVFRRNLSRDLHDTAVHATTAMVMRANQALMRPGLDDDTRRDLQFIADTGQGATETMRHMLATLRSTEDVPDHVEATGPQFRAHLTSAVARLEQAGFEVQANLSIQLSDVFPRALDATGKALTEVTNNVLRHAEPGTEVTLMVENSDDTLSLLCTNVIRVMPDTGTPNPDKGSHAHHYGLVGVRELAESIGGTLTAQPRGPFWVLSLSVPTSPEPPQPSLAQRVRRGPTRQPGPNA